MQSSPSKRLPDVRIKSYAAQDGDALLLQCNGPSPITILVDGGYASTFHTQILQDLKAIALSGHRLDLVVVTHIDADHIGGILSFLRANGSADSPRIIPVDDVWHNSLRCVLPRKVSVDLCQSDREILADITSHGLAAAEQADTEEISALQGSSLAALLLAGKYRWNSGDGTTPICQLSGEVSLGTGLKVKVLGPPVERLAELGRWWLQQLRRLGFAGSVSSGEPFDDAFEFLCSTVDSNQEADSVCISDKALSTLDLGDLHKPDKSITNASSIAILVETLNKRHLLLGDAWSADIESALTNLKQCGDSMIFDTVKLSHHGSSKNTSRELLQLIDGHHFIVPANGGGHPEPAVLREVVDRPSSFTRHLHFNHQTECSDLMKSYQSKSDAAFQVHVDGGHWIDLY